MRRPITEETKTSPVAPPSPKRDRSPNYPAIGPTEALKYAEMIWKRDKRNPVSLDMACQHMGYKAKNGASLPVIAALKRYGLLNGAGADLRVTDEAHTIFIAPADHPERVALVKKLAMRPALFNEVLKKFPDGLPSDENLRFRLQQDFDFANAKAADNFIKSLKDAVALAEVAPGDEIADSESELIAEEADIMTENPAIGTVYGPLPGGPPRPAAQIGNVQTRQWDLGGGSVLTLAIPGKLSKTNIEKLKKYVGALEVEASISWDDDSGATQ
jgi:hypothetical protein